jgi:transketolase
MQEFNREALEKGALGIRKHIVNTIVNNGEGHAGSALSCADILSVLFLAIMNLDSADKAKPCDKFLLSGGHKCLALYGTLVESGIIDRSVLDTYNMLGTKVPGHPDANKLTGVEFSTGSLGHGLPLGCGYAIAAKMKGEEYKTYVLMGDGEQGEGSNWEAAAFAALRGLDNLVAIIDENGLQINGRTADISKPSSFEDRYGAFGWSVKTVDGHDVKALYEALRSVPFEKGKPSMIVTKTVKGKGISFMENNYKYHHWNPGEMEAGKALEEIKNAEKRWQ